MKKIRKYFVTGILMILPLYLSVYILFLMFRFIDGILGNIINVYFRNHFGLYVPGLGLILFFLLIFLAGIISVHFFGRKLHSYVDSAATRFPLLSYIYPAIKQAFEFLFSETNELFKKAVLLEYPCKGCWSVGFITHESFQEAKDKISNDLVNVFIPLAPNPVSGFIALIPRQNIILLDVSVKEAMKLIISAGLVNPGDQSLNRKDNQGS